MKFYFMQKYLFVALIIQTEFTARQSAILAKMKQSLRSLSGQKFEQRRLLRQSSVAAIVPQYLVPVL